MFSSWRLGWLSSCVQHIEQLTSIVYADCSECQPAVRYVERKRVQVFVWKLIFSEGKRAVSIAHSLSSSVLRVAITVNHVWGK